MNRLNIYSVFIFLYLFCSVSSFSSNEGLGLTEQKLISWGQSEEEKQAEELGEKTEEEKQDKKKKRFDRDNDRDKGDRRNKKIKNNRRRDDENKEKRKEEREEKLRQKERLKKLKQENKLLEQQKKLKQDLYNNQYDLSQMNRPKSLKDKIFRRKSPIIDLSNYKP